MEGRDRSALCECEEAVERAGEEGCEASSAGRPEVLLEGREFD